MPCDIRKCRIRTSLTFYEQSDKSRQEVLCFYSASSLKQQSGGRHVVPLGHINMIRNQPVFEAKNIYLFIYFLVGKGTQYTSSKFIETSILRFHKKGLTLLSPERTVSASDKKTTKDNLL
jgi:hypothetical protein